MAKIYETKEDIERTELAAIAAEKKADAAALFNAGFGASIAGGLLLDIDKLRKALSTFPTATVAKDALAKGSSVPLVGHLGRFRSIVGWLGIAAGATAAVFAYFLRRNAKSAEGRLIKLGPQTVVLPDNVFEDGVASVPDIDRSTAFPEFRRQSEYVARLATEDESRVKKR